MREDDPAPVDTASSIPLQGAQTYSGASLPHTAISGPSGNQPRLNAASPQIPRMPVDPRQVRALDVGQPLERNTALPLNNGGIVNVTPRWGPLRCSQDCYDFLWVTEGSSTKHQVT